MKKDDLIEVTIEDLSEEGTGIGKFEGMTFFIKDAVIGDRVRAKIMKLKKTYGFARLMEVLTPSPDRVEPLCPVARQCGGCQIQAMNYEAQLAFKTRKVENNLKRIGKFEEIPMESIIGMEDPFHYRNKAQFPFGKNRDGKIITGFYAGRTHSIIENTSCHLGKEVNEEILEKILAWMNAFHVEPYNEATGKGLMRHSLIRCGFRTGEIMVCLVINGRKIPGEEALVDSLKIIPGMTSISLNVNKEKTNVILGREVINLWGRPYIEDYIGEVKYQISPLSFFQVNPVQTERLYGKALEYAGLTGEETVWDLYCGIGTISLFLARKARKVYGVEIIPDAIEDARRNASLNGFTNTETSMITTACPVTFLLCMFGIGASLTTVGLSVWAADFSCAERRAQSVQRFSALLRHRRACLFVHARHGGRSHGQLRACVRDFCAFRRLFDSDRPVDLPARKQSPNLNARAIFLKL